MIKLQSWNFLIEINYVGGYNALVNPINKRAILKYHDNVKA